MINTCKNCGKEYETPYKGSIFCSRSCAVKFNNSGKKMSEEQKIKISHTLQMRNPNFNGEFKKPKCHKNLYRMPKALKEENVTPMDSNCLTCGKPIERGLKFCCGECKREYDYKCYIERWKNGEETGGINGFGISKYIRRYMLEKSGYKCQKCGFDKINAFTNRSILQIHHIDGNCLNNKEDNLQVLCPNCHAMTDNYGSRNKHATEGRSEYFGRSNSKANKNNT